MRPFVRGTRARRPRRRAALVHCAESRWCACRAASAPIMPERGSPRARRRLRGGAQFGSRTGVEGDRPCRGGTATAGSVFYRLVGLHPQGRPWRRRRTDFQTTCGLDAPRTTVPFQSAGHRVGVLDQPGQHDHAAVDFTKGRPQSFEGLIEVLMSQLEVARVVPSPKPCTHATRDAGGSHGSAGVVRRYRKIDERSWSSARCRIDDGGESLDDAAGAQPVDSS